MSSLFSPPPQTELFRQNQKDPSFPERSGKPLLQAAVFPPAELTPYLRTDQVLIESEAFSPGSGFIFLN
jgi:hypothetical protein